MTNTLNKTIYLRANKADVWAYLTDPEKLGQWFHQPKVPLKEGEPLEMFGTESGDRLIWGDVIAARPHDYLEYTFSIPHMPDTVTTVKWTLEDTEGGTRLTLVHEGLPAGEAAFGLTLALDGGWDGHFARLRDHMHAES